MTKRIALIVAVLCLITGVIVGAWIGEKVEAQSRPVRFEIQREVDFIFIRNLQTGDCFLAVNSGGILQARC